MRMVFQTSRIFVEVIAIISAIHCLILFTLPQFATDVENRGTAIATVIVLAVLAAPIILWRMRRLGMRLSALERHATFPPQSSYSKLTIMASVVVLAVGLGSTLVAVSTLNEHRDTAANARFIQLSNRVQVETARRLEKHRLSLLAVRGLFEASTEVNRSEFRAFFSSQQVAEELRGAYGLAFVQRVNRREMDSFITAERADGAPDFSVHSSGDHEELYVTKFIEPLDANREALGFDVASDPAYREAISRSQRSEQPTLSAAVSLPQDQSNRTAFVYILPVYPNMPDEAVPAATLREPFGWAYAPIVVEEMFAGLSEFANGQLDIEIYDGTEIASASLLFDEDGAARHSEAAPQHELIDGPMYNDRFSIVMGGRDWTLCLSTTPRFDADFGNGTSVLAGSGGSVISMLFACLVWGLGSARSRAIAMAQAITIDLSTAKKRAEDASVKLRQAHSELEQRVAERTSQLEVAKESAESIALSLANQTSVLRNVLSTIPHRVFWKDLDLAYLGCNRKFAEDVGKSRPEDVVGLSDYDNPYTREEADFFRKCDMDVMNSGKPLLNIEEPQHRPDGTKAWLLTSKVPLRSEEGDVIGLLGLYMDITDRKEAEQTLRRVRAAVEKANEAMFTIAPDGRFVDVNMVACERLEYTREELLSMSVTDIDPEFTLERWKAHWENQKQAKSLQFESQHRTKSGIVFPVEVSNAFVQFEGEEYAYAFVTDIRARKEAEAALIESEQRLRLATDAAEIGTWEWNVKEDRVTWSKKCAELLNVPSGTEVTLQRWLECIHAEDRDDAHQGILNALLQEKKYAAEYRVLRNRGRVAWVAVRGHASFDKSGEPRRIQGVLWDTTDQRVALEIRERQSLEANLLHMSAELAANSEDVDSILEQIAEQMCVITGWPMARIYKQSDPDRTYLHSSKLWNLREVDGTRSFTPDAAPMTFLRGEGLPGRVLETGDPCWVGDLSSDETTVQDLWASALGGKATMGFPVEIFDETAAILQFFRRNSCAQDDSLLRIMKDVGAQIGRVLERKRMQHSLRVAKTAAEDASRSKDEFLASMSHELRTPLNGVIGMTELLLGTDLDSRQRRFAEMASSSGESLLMLINDILDLSKIEAGKLDIEVIDFDLRIVVERVATNLSLAAEKKGLELVCAVPPGAPTSVRGDSRRIQQVLLNLANNAIKFTEQGEVVIRVELVSEDDARIQYRFDVRDTGIGIPLDRQDRLFENFSQVDASTTRKYGGTGLGLAISRNLVKLMGGEIGVTSKHGKGSTFWFTATFEKQYGHVDPEPTFSNQFSGVRVLIVDDNATNREIVLEQLSGTGLRCKAASSADQGLVLLRESARSDPFRLALVDMHMPQKDGVQLAREIRDDPHIAGTILVLFSSLGDSANPNILPIQEFDGSLHKPVRRAELVETIERALMGYRALDHAQHPNHDRSTESETESPRSTGLRILLVEDNEIGREAAHALLDRAGYLCDVAVDGQEAIEAVKRSPYDVVLMDCQMPEMDGFESTRIIRQLERDGKIPMNGAKNVLIIALTANAVMGDRERCIESGMDDYVTKPLRIDELLDVIQRQLDSRARSHSSASRVTHGNESDSADSAATKVDRPESPINGNELVNRWGNDTEFTNRLIGEFCKQAKLHLDALEQAIDAGDSEEIARRAHTLVGSSGYVAADAFGDVASRLEREAQDGAIDLCEESLTLLRDELARCVEALPLASQNIGMPGEET